MTIGNAIDAAYARDAGVFIGEGAMRKVYLYNGVVYKFNSGNHNGNAEEFSNYQMLCQHTLPFGVRIPEMELYYVEGFEVIAAEYIDGEKSGECYCYSECDCDTVPDELLWAIRIGFNISDFAWGNFIKKDGMFYLIDMQY